jgi:endonuclease YncB( thermonuclease family)
MTGRRGGVLAVALVAGVAFVRGAGAATQEHGAAVAPAVTAVSCGADEIAPARVGRVVDGRDFVLSDGREVHLAAIEVPLPPVAKEANAAPGGAAAEKALTRLVAGAHVVLHKTQSTLDRYGRIVAYAETLQANARRSVEAEMVSAGFARVADDVGNQACAAELLRRENAARQAKLGLWADPYYEPIPADEPAAILAQRGHFALIEGKVVSVHASGPILYINFGRRWSQDFSVTVRKRDVRKFAAAGFDLQGLAGQRVLVRGWIEAHSGAPGPMGDAEGGGFWRAPWIEAVHPEQIEFRGNDDTRVTR